MSSPTSAACKITVSTNTETKHAATFAQMTRARRGSQVRIVVMTPACQSAPTEDAPITQPIATNARLVPSMTPTRLEIS